jgi:tyrosyl-tRNA synthetase
MTKVKSIGKINEILARGVENFIDSKVSFKKKLIKKVDGEYKEDIIIKYGVDPTKPDIHLGHAVCFRKLRQLQDLGCKIVFLVGDFTAMIGDPTGKSKLRPELSLQEVQNNMTSYITQAKKILDWKKEKIMVIQNSTWYMTFDDLWVREEHKPIPFAFLSKDFKLYKESHIYKNSLKEFDTYNQLLEYYIKKRMEWEMRINKARQFVSLQGMIVNLRKITFDQLIQRDLYDKRIKNNQPVFMNELVYPVLQGVDSLVISKWLGSCDLEIGGTDQHFNMLMGRKMQERNVPSKEAQAVVTLKILEGTDGKEKMSKSLDNYIGITEEPNEMFGKVMSIPDTSIINYFELCTDTPMDEIKKMEKEMKNKKANPRDLKRKLAKDIITIYHSRKEALEAEDAFDKKHVKKEIPDEMEEKQGKKEWTVVEALVDMGLVSSKSEARRKIKEGAVKINGKAVKNIDEEVGKHFKNPKEGIVFQKGKRHFVKLFVK